MAGWARLLSDRVRLPFVIAFAITCASPALASAAVAWEEEILYNEQSPPPVGVVGTGPAEIGDVSGDGIDDVVIAHYGGEKIVVLRGLGGAEFAPPVDTSLGSGPQIRPISLALADLDGDATNEVLVGSTVTFLSLRGTASGALVDPLQIDAARVSQIEPLQFDADGDVDLALAYDQEVRIALGNNNRTFTMPQALRLGPMTAWGGLAAGNLNGGSDDIVAAEDPSGVEGPAELETYVGVGSGVQRFVGPTAERAWFAAEIGEFTGDGAGDVLASNPALHGTVSLLPGDGTGALLPATTVATDGTFEDMVVGDFDNDGFEDAMGLNGSVSQNFPDNGRYPSLLNWIKGSAEGISMRPASPERPRPDGSGFNLDGGDLNGDGRTDFLVSGLEVAIHLSYDDVRPPNTQLIGSPSPKAKRPSKGKAKVRFRSKERGAYFTCKLDRRKRKPCRSPLKLPRLRSGDHKLVVSATDLAGNRERKPAKLKFSVGR